MTYSNNTVFSIDKCMSLVRCNWARQLTRHVPVDVGFLCDKITVLGDTIKGTFYISISLHFAVLSDLEVLVPLWLHFHKSIFYHIPKCTCLSHYTTGLTCQQWREKVIVNYIILYFCNLSPATNVTLPCWSSTFRQEMGGDVTRQNVRSNTDCHQMAGAANK